MPKIPTLYVCHGDTGRPKFHPCRRVQEALNATGIHYEKVVSAHGSPIPFMRIERSGRPAGRAISSSG